ncbi:hypothetical protein LCGC14_2058890 [marine sediment metagenome]|uniref:Uncharacterized protein n=1 Tax=marine sediment metagenome TaxID=412755 RepID=A0A0F9ELM5_9ZZZZ
MLRTTTDLQELKGGKDFTWGLVIDIHEVGEYAVVESHPWKVEGGIGSTGEVDFDKRRYHYYTDGKDCSRSTDSLDGALVGCIAFKREGLNSQAAQYFMKMVA